MREFIFRNLSKVICLVGKPGFQKEPVVTQPQNLTHNKASISGSYYNYCSTVNLNYDERRKSSGAIFPLIKSKRRSSRHGAVVNESDWEP